MTLNITALILRIINGVKVFLGHLHLDHAGDFPAFYFTGPVNNRLTPLRVWGPSGVKPEWGTNTWAQKMKDYKPPKIKRSWEDDESEEDTQTQPDKTE